MLPTAVFLNKNSSSVSYLEYLKLEKMVSMSSVYLSVLTKFKCLLFIAKLNLYYNGYIIEKVTVY